MNLLETDAVTLEINDYIADVRLNRPKKYNAVNRDITKGLLKALERIAAKEEDIRAVVISGNGGNFCSGIDIGMLADSAGGEVDVKSASALPKKQQNHTAGQRMSTGWQELPIPVIAALEGCVFGAGLQIALGADIRFTRADAKLSIMETKWGLLPDVGLTQTIRHLLPRDVALELALTSRVVSGSEAKELGIVTRIADDPLEEAYTTARLIAGKSPDATALVKELFNYAWEHSVDDGLAMEQRLVRQLVATPNHAEAVKANLQKREPQFSARTAQGTADMES